MFHYLLSTCEIPVKLTVNTESRKSTEGKNILCTNREIMHLCQVNKTEQYLYKLIDLIRSIIVHLLVDTCLDLASPR